MPHTFDLNRQTEKLLHASGSSTDVLQTVRLSNLLCASWHGWNNHPAPNKERPFTPRMNDGAFWAVFCKRRRDIMVLLQSVKDNISQMGQIRSRYNESAAFVPRGLLRHGYKEIEDVRLWGSQKNKEQLQQEIMQLEQQLLGLQQQQAQWQAQQG